MVRFLGVRIIQIRDEQISLLIKEGNLASSLIGYGLNALRKSGIHAQGEYYQAFFQLSIGLERLMKLIIIQYFRRTNNTLPNNKEMRNFGHNLVDLYETICTFDTNDQSVNDDEISLKILSLLSEFAIGARYYNLDFLTGKEQPQNPLVAWASIEELIFDRHFRDRPPKSKISPVLAKFLDENSYSLVYNEKNEVMRSTVELLERSEMSQHIQGYAVYYIYQIIHRLTNILVKTEHQYTLYPNLREFFVLFYCGMSQSDIRKKKRWLYP